jgi:uncharacterized protein YutE (UPF0331/DUF86 family)
LGLDGQIIGSRLAALEENLRLLGPLAALDQQAFTTDPRNYGSAERFLQLAIESVFDIGTHCISALRLPRPATYGDILPTLAKASVITRETEGELTSLAGFRNLLVHDYTRVDRVRVHTFLNTRLGGFRRFAADIATFLASQPPHNA